MEEKKGHLQEETTGEQRSREVIFLQEALENLGLGSGLTEEDLESAVETISVTEWFVREWDGEGVEFDYLMRKRREAAEKACPTCGSYPNEEIPF